MEEQMKTAHATRLRPGPSLMNILFFSFFLELKTVAD